MHATAIEINNQLNASQLNEFHEEGYFAVEQLLTKSELMDSRAAIRELVLRYASDPGVAELREPADPSGRVQFRSRRGPCYFELESGFRPDLADPETIELKVRKLMWFEEEAAVFRKIAKEHETLNGVTESVLGPRPELFQSMALIKPPFVGSAKPWHQDNAYFSVTPLDAVIGVWIALDDATVENGCMHVIPGAHREGARRHHHDRDCEIATELLPAERAIPIELPAGGALFFYGMLPHETPANRTPHRRRALQFHYHAANARKVPSAEYDRIFADREGQPASCAAARQQGI